MCMKLLVSHESPIQLFEESLTYNDYQYCLVHLMEESPEYRDWFLTVNKRFGADVLLDNSIFELGTAFDPSNFLNTRTYGQSPSNTTLVITYRYGGGVNHNVTANSIKAITNLTDIGEEDGGTAVVAGSHKSMCEEESMIKAVKNDPSLIHNVVAPAGSTLIFCETLLHATAPITSDNERMIMITGYQPWNHRTNTVRELSLSLIHI